MDVVDIRRAELSGLDVLDTDAGSRASLARRVWATTWPKLLAIAIVIAIWQIVAASNWKPDYALPGPGPTLRRFGHELTKTTTWHAVATTLRRAFTGFALAVVIGLLVGLVVGRFRTVRAGIGALIFGLQTMPSIVWFPVAILWFQRSERAILFVVILGAAPSVANGVISGVDHIPPLLLRAGRVLGARGLSRYRHIVVPAALPGVVAGLKQGWAFAWRSLMAGELLVIIANKPSLGSRLEFEREFADSQGLLSMMILVLIIGITIDAVGFGTIERAIRRRRGLTVT
jgi:NitT/TauT family transport system permease protein